MKRLIPNEKFDRVIDELAVFILYERMISKNEKILNQNIMMKLCIKIFFKTTLHFYMLSFILF